MPYKKKPIHERLYPNGKINEATGCLEWQRWRDKDGYGWLGIEGKNHRVHRLAYADKHGPIPDGFVVMHLCNNPSCFNVDHLAVGTQLDNIRYKKETGRQIFGEATYNSRITNEQAIAIADMIRVGMNNSKIAESFGLEMAYIQKIRSGLVWTDVTGIPKWEKATRRPITAEVALKVVEMSRNGIKNKDIAKQLDLSTVLISNLLTGYAWGKVTGIKYNPTPRIKK